MTNQKTVLSLIAIFVAIFLISFASAFTLSLSNDLTIAKNTTILTIASGSDPTQTISFPSSLTISEGTNSITVTPNATSISLTTGTSQTILLSATGALSAFSFGEHSATLTAVSNNVSIANVSKAITFYKGFCTNGPTVGTNLSVTSVDVSNDGDDDTTWMPLDTITVDVDFENNGAGDKVKGVVIELAIFDSNGEDQTDEFDFLNSDEDKVKYGSLEDDDTVTFEFQVPASMEAGDYDVVAKAYSTTEGQTNTCDENDGGVAVSVEKQSDSGKYISFVDIELTPTEASCGETVTLTTDVYNVGDAGDQDQVRVTLYNKDLKLSETYELKSGINEGENERVSFEFAVPKGLTNKNYNLELSAEYDYRSSTDTYRQESDDSTDVTLKVIGCESQITTGLSGITASLESDAKAGSDLEITTTIKNLGSTSATLAVSASGYESWATLNSISDATITLAAGASKNVTISLKVNEAVSGEQTFKIESKSGTNVDSKTVAVEISEGSWLSSLKGSFGSNSTLWLIGAVNLVLIALIVFLAIRVFRK